MKPCPCGSGTSLPDCCGRFLSGKAKPDTAEQLMRSRYAAYVLQHIDYLKETLWPPRQASFDVIGTANWASQNYWTGLAIIKCENGRAEDKEGTVLFEAQYLSGGKINTHREKSRFRKKAGRWFYVEGLPEG